MENKQKYIAPVVKCVEFKTERGFATSLTQGFGSGWGSRPTDLHYEDFDNYYGEGTPFHTGGRFGGFFTGNNEDWD